MDGQIEASWAGIWLAVNAKCALIYVLVSLASAAFWCHRPAWRSWAWLMVILSFAVLTGLELMRAGSGRGLVGLDRREAAVLAVALQVYSLAVAGLLGLVIDSFVRLTLLKRHSPPMNLDLGLAGQGDRALGPAMRLLRQTHFRSSDAVLVPTSFGVLRPTVVLPTAIQGAVYQSVVRAAVVHEFFAVVRFDALWTLLARLVQCIHFLNPVVWLAFRHYRRASEQIRDDWAAYAIGDAGEYISHLALVADAASARRLMALDTPMARRAGERDASLRLARLAGRNETRPEAITRPQLALAVVAWLVLLAVPASLQLSLGSGGSLRVAFAPPVLGAGLAVAALAGAGLMAGTLGARRGPWRQVLSDPGAPGVYRQTVAWCVQRVEREWQAMQPFLSLAGRVADPVVLLLLIVALATMGWLLVLEPAEEGPYRVLLWGYTPNRAGR